MSREDIEQLVDRMLLTLKYAEEQEWKVLAEYIEDLQQENKQLKDKIESAIEYIKEHTEDSQLKIYGISDCKIFKGSIEELLEILGDKNENRR